MTPADRLQPYIVAEHRRSVGMACAPFDHKEAMADTELLAYARAEIARLRASGQRILAEYDHESKIRCQALERMVAAHDAQEKV
jgi:hypothetical protein